MRNVIPRSTCHPTCRTMSSGPSPWGALRSRVEHASDVGPVVEKANSIDDQPVVIDFRTDSREKVFPMVPAGQSNSDVIVHPGLRPGGEKVVQ